MCPGAPGNGLEPDWQKSRHRRMYRRPKLSPPQTCAALIDPREPYKLTSGIWTGKMAKVCAQGSLALRWEPDCKKSIRQRMDPRPILSPPGTCAALIDPREPNKLTSGTWTDRPKGALQTDISNLE
ncbi:hypothetical protein RLOC_00002929 [Lonchura striata]|uniref:Uncharacterized protein n=1 Tax=Lonchura striata TaxID=40157 RepID=A0A218UU99_9PASE|nr:hypothetical protein RLOC_00002929 [Lonchura striata domestica]